MNINAINGNTFVYLLLFLFFLYNAPLEAQDVKGAYINKNDPFSRQWYIGLQGGLPFGVSTFSSFGADKTRVGWNTGLHGGYHFNPAISLGFSASFGKLGMSARKCCDDYWLGSNGHRYLVPVAGMEGWNYSDLYSRVNLQRYGLHLHVNMLGLIPATVASRWSVNLSPAIYGVGSKAAIKTIGEDRKIWKGKRAWHLGVGGDFSVGYRMTENLSVNLYSSIIHLTGKQMDAVPQYYHKSNFIWENGLKVGWTFGKNKKQIARFIPVSTDKTVIEPLKRDDYPEKITKETVTVTPVLSEKKEDVKEKITPVTVQPVRFPVIYFPFNVTSITSDQMDKMYNILIYMRQHPDVHILLTGWSDKRGNKFVNNSVSLLRAQAVQTWLEKKGIDINRITVRGKGSDTNETDLNRCRRVEAEINNKEEDEK